MQLFDQADSATVDQAWLEMMRKRRLRTSVDELSYLARVVVSERMRRIGATAAI